VVGVINAYAAIMAEQAGFKALYVSGAGVANASYGLPDLGMTTLGNVAEDVRRITAATELPVLVDIDTGWESSAGIEAALHKMIEIDAAAIHIEDQVDAKRCGHRPGKILVSADDMVKRVTTAVAARGDSDLVVMARTDAASVEGLDAAIVRAKQYCEAGADMIFSEALGSLEDYETFTQAIQVPLLANITEFGMTPLFTTEELARVGVRMALYPLSAFRAMNAAANHVYKTLRAEGTQKSSVDAMQTRDELYGFLNYYDQEKEVDDSHGEDENNG